MRPVRKSPTLVLAAVSMLLACTLAGACQNRDTVVKTPGSPDTAQVVSKLAPQPGPACPEGAPPSDTTQLNDCLKDIVFDTVPALGDEQRLMIPTRRYGPLAKIEPVIGAHDYSDDDLREGRIIARFFTRRGEKGYPKLGIVPGQVTHWWVQLDRTGRGGTSTYISANAKGQISRRRDALRVDPHPGRFKQAVARWVWYEDDEKGQGTCGQACCK
jgi:hypothetical protein